MNIDSDLPVPAEETGTLASQMRMPPNSIEAEQSLLGAILLNNEAYFRVSEFLKPDHFYEPVHARLFEAIERRVSEARLADPVTLRRLFDEDPSLADVDGGEYLARIARAAESIVNAEHYGRLIHDLALKRGLIRVGEDAVNDAYDSFGDTAGRELIEQAERDLFVLAQEGEIEGGFKEFPKVVTNAVKMVEDAFNKEGKVTGVPTGLTGVDEKLGGMQPSDLIVLAARPSMGKTALAITMAANASLIKAGTKDRERLSHPNHTVAVFSLEMSAEQLAMRLLSAESQIGSDDLRKGQMRDDRDWQRLVEASQALSQRPLYIDDTPALSVAAVRTRARRLMRRHGLSLIVVDYLQLLRGTTKQSQSSRVLEIGEITMTLKAVAKELQVPVLALSQLSRAVESRDDKRPQLSDLRDSGSIEQDADVVMFLYREEYYLSRQTPQPRDNEKPDDFTKRYQGWVERLQASHNKAELIVAKQRNGPIGPVMLQFDASFGRFHNLEGDYDRGLEPM